MDKSCVLLFIQRRFETDCGRFTNTAKAIQNEYPETALANAGRFFCARLCRRFEFSLQGDPEILLKRALLIAV